MGGANDGDPEPGIARCRGVGYDRPCVCAVCTPQHGAGRATDGGGAGWVGDWNGVCRLTAFLQFLDENPAAGRLVVVESLGAGPNALDRRRNALMGIIGVVDCGRREAKAASEPTKLTAEGIVGGVISVIHARLLEAKPKPLVSLVNELMSMIVLPYLGPSAAKRELQAPMPKGSGRASRPAKNPLKDLDMRLTYRTVRVLMAVVAHPGSSNREVAEGAGIADQGQISKLLARLHGLDLIENVGVGSARGEPNAWALTEHGEEVAGVIARQSVP